MQESLLINRHKGEKQTQKSRYLCPICNKHTVLWLLPTTEIKDLPIKCKRCGKESIINIDPVSTV